MNERFIQLVRSLIKDCGHAPAKGDIYQEWSLILGPDDLPLRVECQYDDCHEIGRAVAPFMPVGVTADHEACGLYWYAPSQGLRNAAAGALARWAVDHA